MTKRIWTNSFHQELEQELLNLCDQKVTTVAMAKYNRYCKYVNGFNGSRNPFEIHADFVRDFPETCSNISELEQNMSHWSNSFAINQLLYIAQKIVCSRWIEEAKRDISKLHQTTWYETETIPKYYLTK